jgi:hypothetical protein
METLFDVEKSGLVSLEDVDGLQGIQPKVWTWLRRLFFNGDLELVASLLKNRGMIKEGQEAPAFLVELVTNTTRRTRSISISFGDLQRLTHNGLRDFLRDQLGSEETDDSSDLTLYRTCGSISHQFAAWLYTHPVRFATSQLPLFNSRGVQQELFEVNRPRDLFTGLDGSNSAFAENRLHFDRQFLAEANECILALSLILKSPNEFTRCYFESEGTIVRFQNLMRANFPEHVGLLGAEANLNEIPALVSLVGWVGLLNRRLCEDRGTVSLTEVPVMPRDAEVWAGRIDRLDILDGKTAAFRGLCRDNIHAASEFVERALRLHPSTCFKIVDWKFSVGDNGDRLIPGDAFAKRPGELSRTFQKHVDQVQWYVLWLRLQHELANGRDGRSFPDDKLFTGLLTYVLQNGELVDVPVEPAPKDLERRFVEQVVCHWETIRGKRDTRVLNNAAKAALREQLANGVSNGNHEDAKLETPTNGDGSPSDHLVALPDPAQLPLGLPGIENHPVGALVDSYREYVDPETRVIEAVGNGESVRYRMHLGNLARAIKAGTITIGRNFSWERGGHICCFVHQEKTPSMHLNFKRGTFHCFGCSVGGTFAREDMPLDLYAIVPMEHIGRRRLSSHGLPEIPEETAKIMAAAQEILSSNFPGSIAERYLTRERFLDPDLLRSVGAGCAVRDGKDILIQELAGAGYSVDDLVAQGFLLHHEITKQYNPAVKALQTNGIPLETIGHQRKVRRLTGESEILTEWPFDVLSRRATFPLSLPIGSRAVITGFYGRTAQREKGAHPHHVLSPSDVPKGFFNGGEIAEQIATGGVTELYLTEGVIDALVLMTLGHCPVAAIIGTEHSAHLLKFILNLNPNEVYVALDFDAAGSTATTAAKDRQGRTRGIMPWLAEKGFKGDLYNFSSVFASHHPEVRQFGYDDFGTWWENHGQFHHPYQR